MITWIVLALIAGGLIWGFATYNSLVAKSKLVEEGWSGIETQLKRRADLIPNLVETVKGYAGHEREALEDLTRLRTQAERTGADHPAERGQVEREVTAAIGRILAVAEAYPDLKASSNFGQLQSDLADTENQINLARRYYNGAVRELNTVIQQAPSNLIAQSFGFREAEFFEIENAADRALPKVSFQ